MKITKSPLAKLISLCALVLGFKILASSNTRSKSTRKNSPTETSFDHIDAYVEIQMKSLKIPGAALAIVEGDKIVHARGFGISRPGGETPLLKTPFFIDSLTKSFTALAIMQLVEAGKITLDAPVIHYLPWFKVNDIEATTEITVRHLLNQTSGLPALPGELALSNLDTSPNATERQVRDLSNTKLIHPVGAICEYSNLNYNILGLIIETTSGKSYSDYIQCHIFDPLEMHHSHTSKEAAQKDGLAVGYRHWFSLPFPASDFPIPKGSLPSGQLISSAEDMGHFLIAHLNKGHYRKVQILSEDGIDKLHRGVKEYIAMGMSSGRYAMGWFDNDTRDVKVLSHSGNVPNFSAHMAILPEQKKGFILLFNADPYGLPLITKEIGSGVTSLLADQDEPPIRMGFIKWFIRFLPFIPLFQVIKAINTLRKGRWQKQPDLSPKWRKAWGRRLIPSLIPNLTLAGGMIYLQASGLIRFMDFYMPDLALIIRINGTFATIWSFLRTVFFLSVFHKEP